MTTHHRKQTTKQPNSAIRKCARFQLIKNGKKIAAFVPNDGCLKYIEENVIILLWFRGGTTGCCYYANKQLSLSGLLVFLQDEVLIADFGRKGHAVGDIPGVRFKVVNVSGVISSGSLQRKEGKAKWGQVLRAKSLCLEMDDQFHALPRNKTLHNYLVYHHCKEGEISKAIGVVMGMVDKGCEINSHSYNKLIHGFHASGYVGYVEVVLSSNKIMLEKGCIPNVITCKILNNKRYKDRKCEYGWWIEKLMLQIRSKGKYLICKYFPGERYALQTQDGGNCIS
ncbi:hypothetical protein Sjap_001615 [Stephania japonica]|uniref:Uncharacterized protein n=1 Tax=Stephania japonica TaxID=461633 RepID=A0AAP0PTG1_9MAGN